MSIKPLPNTLDVRKAAVREVTVSGAIKPANLPRLREVLAADSGEIQATLAFSKDEENRFVIDASVTADISITCQRCLESMSLHLETSNTLAVVWNDEYAGELPRYLDALIVADEPCSLWELVEEELILGLPSFNYHEQTDCNEILTGISQQPTEDEGKDEKPNPFDVLAQLKLSK